MLCTETVKCQAYSHNDETWRGAALTKVAREPRAHIPVEKLRKEAARNKDSGLIITQDWCGVLRCHLVGGQDRATQK